ncbi:MAG: PhnD/SsuA/transferrin family substrate-binding protein [Desulfobulbaceae bacterium]|nr:PhnD/SsuA/transferrin family substrate-binding protein [Desulfobulbaceae bacterium]
MSRLAITLWLAIALMAWNPAWLSAAPAKEVKIAVRAYSGVEAAAKKWSATATYLSQEIEGYHFVMIPMVGFDEMETAVEQSQVDFVLTNSAAYIGLKESFSVSRILTLVNNVGGKAEKQFGGVIFARADRMDIRDFSDIKGKIIIGVHEEAFGGWRMQLGELKKHGISPDKDCRQILFADGLQEPVVFAVKEGKADVGTVRTGIMERLAEKGEINLADFIILGRKTDDFIYPHSTPLYPEWPLAKLVGTSDKLAKKVAVALMSMPEKHPAAQQGGYAGWIPPLSYSAVVNLMKDLRVGPYEKYGHITYVGAAKKIGQWLLVLIVFAGGFFLAILYKKRKLETLVGARTEELQIEKDNFLNILNSMTDGVYIVDDQYNIEFVNETLKKEFGESQGKKCYSYFHDREAVCPWCKNAEVFKGKTVRWQWRSSQNQKYYDLIDSPLKNPDGSISKLEIFREITEIKQIQNRLEQSANRLSSIFRAAPAGIGVIVDRVFNEVNERFCDMIGYTKEELLGKNARIVYPTDEEFEYVGREKYKQISERGTGTVETRMLRKDGKVIDVLLSSTPLNLDDRSTGVTFTATDISEIKDTERRLSQSEERYKEAQTLARLGHWDFKPHEDSVSWSDELYSIFGVDKDAGPLSFADILQHIHPEDRDAVREQAEKGEDYRSEYRIVMDDGSVKNIHEEVMTVRQEDGKIILMRGTAQDITERKQAEVELEKYKNHLESLVKEQTAELEEKVAELERMNDLFVGREFRIKELRDRVKELEEGTDTLAK